MDFYRRHTLEVPLAVNGWRTIDGQGAVFPLLLHLPALEAPQTLDARHCLATRSAWRSGLLIAGRRRRASLDDEWPDPTAAQHGRHLSWKVLFGLLEMKIFYGYFSLVTLTAAENFSRSLNAVLHEQF